jgi:hypothetical protein
MQFWEESTKTGRRDFPFIGIDCKDLNYNKIKRKIERLLLQAKYFGSGKKIAAVAALNALFIAAPTLLSNWQINNMINPYTQNSSVGWAIAAMSCVPVYAVINKKLKQQTLKTRKNRQRILMASLAILWSSLAIAGLRVGNTVLDKAEIYDAKINQEIMSQTGLSLDDMRDLQTNPSIKEFLDEVLFKETSVSEALGNIDEDSLSANKSDKAMARKVQKLQTYLTNSR